MTWTGTPAAQRFHLRPRTDVGAAPDGRTDRQTTGLAARGSCSERSSKETKGTAMSLSRMHWRYRCPNSAGRPFGSWHGTNLARSKHGPARSVTGPGRHGPFSGPGMGTYGGPRALARPGTINGSARRRPAYLCKY
jgi:hypothetical protein